LVPSFWHNLFHEFSDQDGVDGLEMLAVALDSSQKSLEARHTLHGHNHKQREPELDGVLPHQQAPRQHDGLLPEFCCGSSSIFLIKVFPRHVSWTPRGELVKKANIRNCPFVIANFFKALTSGENKRTIGRLKVNELIIYSLIR